MIPILFPADAETYTTQGLGALSDAISCKVREERNGEFELEMQYPQAGLHFYEISDRCIIMAIPSPWRAAQPFRIYRITKPLGGVCTIYARHITYDLSGIPVNVFSAQSAAGALSGLKTNSATPNPFEFWTDKQTSAAFAVSVPASIRSLLGGSTGSVLDVYGGEYEWDGWTVRLHEHRGTDRGVTIRYGKNLTDIEQDRNIANVRTGLYPYWADSDGNLVVCDPPIVNAPGSYDFINIQTVDFSQEWQDAPTPAQLKARAEQYIQANEIGVPTVSISVSFVDLSRTDQYKDLALLEQCDLCDTVAVQFEALGVDATAEVVSIETDVLLERYDKIEVGSPRTNIADTIVDNQQRTDEQIKQTTSYLEDRIQQSTDLITNGGGYIYRKFDAAKNWVEIGSTDNLDLSKAIHVWRWNNGGFGHSRNGYNGPYRTAITQDGHIVADFVDTGSLTANIIKAGILQNPVGAGHTAGDTFFLDLDNGILRMNAAQISINSSAVATQTYADGQASTALSDAKTYADSAASAAKAEAIQNAVQQAEAAFGQELELYPTTVQMNSAIKQSASEIGSQVSLTLEGYSTKEYTDSANRDAKSYADAAAQAALVEANRATDGKLAQYPTKIEMNSAITQSASQITSEVSLTLEQYSTTEESEAYADQAAGAAEDAANEATDNKLQNYSTTVQMNSAIQQSANNINLQVSQTLTQYSTTEESEQYADNAANNAASAANAATDSKLKSYSTTIEMESAIEQKANSLILEVGQTYATKDSLSGYTKTSEVRSRFAMDPTSVTISSGRITFNSNTLVIDSSNFSLDSNGAVTLRSNGSNGYVQIYNSYITFRNNSGRTLITIFPESDNVGVIRFFNGSGGFISDLKSSVQGGQGNIQLNVSGSGFFDVNRARISELTCPDSKIYSDKYMAIDGEVFAQMSGSYKELLPDNLYIGKGTFSPYQGKNPMYLDWVQINNYWVLAGFSSPH